MAPQHVEKIESAVGNGMASDASKPQDVVAERAADELRLTRRWGGSGSYSRSEMAPQRVEKIESAPGNCMASEASKPQDVVGERAADRERRPRDGGLYVVFHIDQGLVPNTTREGSSSRTESALGNGMVSEAAKPQDVVDGAAVASCSR
jgi:hypothetical protein